jgi:citrate lyase subunit beta/citryl-CoA lyase
MMAAIEGAIGVVNAFAIATASKRLIAIALGAEDYCANLKTSRSKEGTELFLARSTIVVAARAAGIDAIDTVFSDVNDEEQLVRETQAIKQLGFDGKSVINPRQIKPVHRVFTPTANEISKAQRILTASRGAEARGSGVVSLNGKMIDRPVVIRAERTLELAVASRVVFEEDDA